MQISVDPNRIDELTAAMEDLAHTIETGETYLNRELSQLIGNIASLYLEYSSVRSVAADLSGLLVEIRQLAE